MQAIFQNSIHELGDIYSYYFATTEKVVWQAGQYVNVSLHDLPPVYSDRLFTITSAPHQPYIQITTLITESPFKQKLAKLKAGDQVTLDQQGGDFLYDIPTHVLNRFSTTLQNNTKRLFIAGGIGITPYISIIRDRLHKKLPIQATLLYAGKSHRRPFIEELKAVAQKDPTLVLHHFEDERLTADVVQKVIPDVKSWVVYLAGSQTFSESIGEGLLRNGIPRDQIKYDYFDGYVDIEY